MSNYSKTYKVRLNSAEKIEELLQETYDYSQRLINEIQIEMNKLSQSTDLTQAMPDERSKYAKSMHDYITDKNKAISMKLDISKLLSEILKYNGDVNKAITENSLSKDCSSLNLDKIKQIISDSQNEEREEYKIKKH